VLNEKSQFDLWTERALVALSAVVVAFFAVIIWKAEPQEIGAPEPQQSSQSSGCTQSESAKDPQPSSQDPQLSEILIEATALSSYSDRGRQPVAE
jgi:sugar phosphate permease